MTLFIHIERLTENFKTDTKKILKAIILLSLILVKHYCFAPLYHRVRSMYEISPFYLLSNCCNIQTIYYFCTIKLSFTIFSPNWWNQSNVNIFVLMIVSKRSRVHLSFDSILSSVIISTFLFIFNVLCIWHVIYVLILYILRYVYWLSYVLFVRCSRHFMATLS